MSEYKLVPVEPTEEMLNAGAINIRVSLKRITDANNIYKAMLSASPTTDTITIDRAEYEAMKADAEIGKLARSKMISCNSIPVSRCTITKDEIEAIDQARKNV